MILANGCNIKKSEKFKGVWILSVPTVHTVHTICIYIYIYTQHTLVTHVKCRPKHLVYLIIPHSNLQCMPLYYSAMIMLHKEHIESNKTTERKVCILHLQPDASTLCCLWIDSCTNVSDYYSLRDGPFLPHRSDYKAPAFLHINCLL